jgi:heme-degrading monooxygenase HmoA
VSSARAAEPPYVAVIFTSQRGEHGETDYANTAEEMEALAAQQPGYLGIESARDASGFGITVSYWANEDDARAWKRVAEHADAQRRGRDEWYERYDVRVATVTRQYGRP